MKKRLAMITAVLILAGAGLAFAQDKPAGDNKQKLISKDLLDKHESQMLDHGEKLPVDQRLGAYSLLALAFNAYSETGKATFWGEKYAEISISDKVVNRRANVYLMLIGIYCRSDNREQLQKALKYLDDTKKLVDANKDADPELAGSLTEDRYTSIRLGILKKLG